MGKNKWMVTVDYFLQQGNKSGASEMESHQI